MAGTMKNHDLEAALAVRQLVESAFSASASRLSAALKTRSDSVSGLLEQFIPGAGPAGAAAEKILSGGFVVSPPDRAPSALKEIWRAGHLWPQAAQAEPDDWAGHLVFSANRALTAGWSYDALFCLIEEQTGGYRLERKNTSGVTGFSASNIATSIGGAFRSTYRPVNDAIVSGRIAGIAGVVGQDSEAGPSAAARVALVKKLVSQNVLVVTTGSADGLLSSGLLSAERASEFAGSGLAEVCSAAGLPAVLHFGPSYRRADVMQACLNIIAEGGLGNSPDKLPVAGVALDWVNPEAVLSGVFFVASGITVALGSPFPFPLAAGVAGFLTSGIEKITGSKFIVTPEEKAADTVFNCLLQKRAELKLSAPRG